MSGKDAQVSDASFQQSAAHAVLPSDGLSLWFAYPDDLLDAALSNRAIEQLTADERTRLLAFRFDKHRREYLATRLLVRSALSHHDPLKKRDWQFRRNEYGKPRIEPPCGLRFNLANSLGLVVCLISHGNEVGVDVEPYTRAGEVLELADEVFAPAELTQLNALPHSSRAARALSLWTLKEAYIKARGMGLSLPLKEIAFLFDGESGMQLELSAGLDDDAALWRFSLVDYADHRVAMVVKAEDSTVVDFYEFPPAAAAPVRLDGITVVWSPRS